MRILYISQYIFTIDIDGILLDGLPSNCDGAVEEPVHKTLTIKEIKLVQ